MKIAWHIIYDLFCYQRSATFFFYFLFFPKYYNDKTSSSANDYLSTFMYIGTWYNHIMCIFQMFFYRLYNVYIKNEKKMFPCVWYIYWIKVIYTENVNNIKNKKKISKFITLNFLWYKSCCVCIWCDGICNKMFVILCIYIHTKYDVNIFCIEKNTNASKKKIIIKIKENFRRKSCSKSFLCALFFYTIICIML